MTFWVLFSTDFGGDIRTFWELLGHFGPWAVFGRLWGRLHTILEPSWGHFGLIWTILWSSWSHPGPSWGSSWADLGGLVAVLGPSCADLGGLVALFGHLRAILNCPGPACGHLGPILEPCWTNSGAHLGACRQFRKYLQATCQKRFQIQAEDTDHPPQELKGLEVGGGVAFENAGSKTLSQIHAFSHFGLCSLQAYSRQTSPCAFKCTGVTVVYI